VNLSRTIGQKLRKLREDRGFSQEELADRAGIHRTYIGSIERAERNITVLTLQKLLTALNITFEQFFKAL
jgi:XRE family transcriptional regulator, regulator of sulfur utilization